MHGLRMPNEAFFHWNPKLLGLGRQIGQINFGALVKNTFNVNLPLGLILPNCGKLVSFHQNIVSEYAKLMETIHIPSLFLGNFVQNLNYYKFFVLIIKKRRSLRVGIWLQKGYYLTVKYFHICELYVEICG